MGSLLVTGIFSLWLYTAHILPERYGVMALALTLVAYMANMDGGFRTVISRAVLAEGNNEKREELLAFGQKLYTWLNSLILAGNVLLMAVYALMPGPRAEGLGLAFFTAFAVSNALLVGANIQAGMFIAVQEQSRLFILQTLGAWAGVNALAFALTQGWDLWAIPFSSFISFVAIYPLSVRWIKKTFPTLRIFDWRIDQKFRAHFHALKIEAWYCFRAPR